MKIEVEQIGIIRTPFTSNVGMPIQPMGAKDVVGTAELFDRYAAGLRDLDGFGMVYLIYLFHQAPRTELELVPYLDTSSHGVFATRSPLRPSHIGMSIVEILGIEDNLLRFNGSDMLDETPLIDIKPYVPAFDCHPSAATGWMTASPKQVSDKRSDERFA